MRKSHLLKRIHPNCTDHLSDFPAAIYPLMSQHPSRGKDTTVPHQSVPPSVHWNRTLLHWVTWCVHGGLNSQNSFLQTLSLSSSHPSCCSSSPLQSVCRWLKQMPSLWVTSIHLKLWLMAEFLLLPVSRQMLQLDTPRRKGERQLNSKAHGLVSGHHSSLTRTTSYQSSV